MKIFASIILCFFLLGCAFSKKNLISTSTTNSAVEDSVGIHPSSVIAPQGSGSNQNHWNAIMWILLGSIVVCCLSFLPNLKNKISKLSND